MRDLLQEIRHAARALGRSPGFALAAVLTLGLGIGAGTAVFGLVRGVLLRPLPFRDPDAVVAVHLITADNPRYPLSIPDLLDYRREARSLSGLAAIAGMSVNLTGAGEAERLQGVRASGDLFPLLGVPAELGRTLLPEDDRTGEHVVVITHGLFTRRFGADSGLLGRSLTLNGEAYVVVGILPPRFRFPTPAAELAVPLAPERDPRRADRRATGILRTVGRLAPGVTIAQAGAELNAIARRLQREFPDANATKRGVQVTPYLEEVTGPAGRPLAVLAGAVGCLILVGCANLAGLMLVRSAGRRRELAVRAALGATRGRLARLLLVESLMLSSAGGLLGLLVAVWGTAALAHLPPRILPRAHEIAADGRVFLFGAALAILTGIACGIGPALLASRADLTPALKGAAAAAGGGRPQRRPWRPATAGRGRRLLVAGEIALAMLLLAGAGLLLRSFACLAAVDPGFDPRGILVARLALPKERYARPEPMTQFHDRLRERLLAIPGVESASFISVGPMSGVLASANCWREDHPPADPAQAESVDYRVVSPGYLRTMRTRLVRGRDLDAGDRADAPPVALINEALSARLFPGEDPIGRALVVDDSPAGPRRVTIVGVSGDVRHEGLDTAPTGDLLLPVAQVIPNIVQWLANNQFWMVRAAAAGRLDPPAVQAAVRAVDADVAASNLRPLDAYLDETTGLRRLNATLIGGFALAALGFSAMGLYGLVAFSVSQRTLEIGIRVALGAERAKIVWLVLGEGMRLLAAGLFAGATAALLLGRLLAGLLFGIPPHDPATFAGVALALGGVALLACWVPARSAARITPIEALRGE